MSQQDELITDDDAVDFGEADTGEKKPFWKRELLFGYSLPWLLGAALLAGAGIWYLYGPSLSGFVSRPGNAEFSEVDHTLNDTAGTAQPAVLPQSGTQTGTQPEVTTPESPAMHGDTVAMMTDIRDELNARDSRINDTLGTLKDSVSQISEAIKRDEAYAVETRNQLMALTQRLAALESRLAASTVATPKSSSGKRQAASPVAGMKVVSLENGMAWIKWQGSTWAVREGDTLGKVTVSRIDPASRSVTTSGGTLR
ncbi:TPA: conjugal transfer protein TraP [Salmonella enterica]|uniref:conjugal transfer protein TraP n=1 Tax=Enterobacter roggenkampii TaxID=1812935 RepID=UPI0019B2AE48|nr:conjugal transfer protein TraP [Salmonella enterica subsp. enterica serovar Orion]HAK7475007.1 conjugal transfer protein TraP [Salmonella enterica]EJR7832921.1 conjugal transfer protein TraP [Salmonella enterica subsp. enterica serovar Orion]HAK8236182.1 conjugal transfer protein TraP [Salmonella enterica]HAK8531591.1 conjugal transfer protein TraP [Salmonella enterica]